MTDRARLPNVALRMSTSDLRRRLDELGAAVVAEVEMERVAVLSQLYDTATVPVLTLPVEITAEIFTLCLPTFPAPESSHRQPRRIPGILNSRAPTVFLGVCRAWRDIALGTPTLWSTLEIGFDTSFALNPERVQAFMQWWLDRAALCPLSLKFQYRDPSLTFDCIRNVIHQYASRIGYLDIYLNHEPEIHLLDLDVTAFPILEHVVLQTQTMRMFAPHPVTVFSNAPLLHILSLPHGGTSSLTFPSLQLTEFEG
ncbi:hypothetical protein DFH07DRAFT_241723 [Mycena maculata]|uniref:F-box domain-containing protein n=1 Tax=Mycena maculata TaxID=230809 RepID=A0AAD7JSV0_9AGAR|nr:hypothetical protein DFH07DRAFT_241723 [Mycena maculata]